MLEKLGLLVTDLILEEVTFGFECSSEDDNSHKLSTQLLTKAKKTSSMTSTSLPQETEKHHSSERFTLFFQTQDRKF